MAGALRRRVVLQRLTALAAAATVSVLTTACGGRSARRVRSPSEPVTLVEWNFTQTRVAWQQDALRRYQQAINPELRIRWVTLPYNELHEKLLMTVLAGSGGPDLADVEISAFARFLKDPRPGFLPLNDRLARAGALDALYQPAATDPWSWNGQIYGLGNELNVCLWCYNWPLLERYDIDVPITSWAQFAAAGKALSQRSRGQAVLMDFMDLDWADWWMRTLEGGGGCFDARGVPTLDNEVAIAALQYGRDAVHRDRWSITSPSGNAYNAALLNGRIASLLGPSWRFSGFLQQALPMTTGWWHLQLMPRWSPEGGGAATLGGTGVCAMRNGRVPDLAADFLVWAHTTPAAVLADFRSRQVWPTLKAALAAPELAQPIAFFDRQNIGQLIREAAPRIPRWYNSPYWAEVTDAVVRLGITPAMHDTVAPAAALRAAQGAARSLIAVERAT